MSKEDKYHNKYINKYNKKLVSVRNITKLDNGCCMPNTLDTKCKGKKRLLKQRKKYRFDERETWNMDYTSLVWLYEHIKMFLDIGGKIVDLDYPLLDEDKREFSEKENLDFNSKREVLEYICHLIEQWDRLCDDTVTIDCWEPAQQAIRLYAMILPGMWW